MKTLNKIFGLAVISSLLFSCGDEFLETEPTEFVSARQIADYSEENPGLQGANVAGMYALMYETGTGGTTGHDDYGHKAYDMYADIISGDMVLGGLNYGWYSTISRYQVTTDYTFTDNYQVWRHYYRMVFAANSIIDQFGGNDVMPETAEGKSFYAQAKAMRGISYFYLANYFSEGYNPSEPILPLYLSVPDAGGVLETSETIYNAVLDDLGQAVGMLAETPARDGKEQINIDVAETYLAYAYAAIGNNQMAADHTQNVIDRANHPIMNASEITTSGFNDANTPGWIWGVDITLDQGLDLISWWGQLDVFTYSYAWVGDVKSINDDLWNELNNRGDIRAQQFADVFGTGQKSPINKFFAPARTIGGQRNITTDYVYLRMAEVYLLNAETNAKLGNEGIAKTNLLAAVGDRWPTASADINALSGQALLDEISFQTRAELWGEGKSYLELKRNERTIVLPPNHLTNAGDDYQYNSDELTFEIPLLEVQNNPNITVQ